MIERQAKQPVSIVTGLEVDDGCRCGKEYLPAFERYCLRLTGGSRREKITQHFLGIRRG